MIRYICYIYIAPAVDGYTLRQAQMSRSKHPIGISESLLEGQVRVEDRHSGLLLFCDVNTPIFTNRHSSWRVQAERLLIYAANLLQEFPSRGELLNEVLAGNKNVSICVHSNATWAHELSDTNPRDSSQFHSLLMIRIETENLQKK